MEKTATGDELFDGRDPRGRAIEIAEVGVGDEECGDGGGEDDDFGGGFVVGGLSPEEEVVEVRDEAGCEEVDGGIVDEDAGDVGGCGEGEGAVFRRGRRTGNVAAVKTGVVVRVREVLIGGIFESGADNRCHHHEGCQNGFELHCKDNCCSEFGLEDSSIRRLGSAKSK